MLWLHLHQKPSLGLTSFHTGCRYQGQRQSHAAILARFEADLQDISGIELHPVARTDKLKRLSDLVPVAKLRKWAAHCQEGHDKFVEKVCFCVARARGLLL